MTKPMPWEQKRVSIISSQQDSYLNSILGTLRGKMLALDPAVRAAAKIEYAKLQEEDAERAERGQRMKEAAAAHEAEAVRKAAEEKEKRLAKQLSRRRRRKRKAPLAATSEA